MAYVGNTYTTQGFVPAIDYFSGNGSTTAFTLSRPVASVAQVQVTIENVPQNPSSAFTVSSNTITFTSAPPSGTNNIYVQYTSPITQVVALTQSPQVFGNLQFSSAGARITGDFSNATLANRVAFQSSTTNGETSLVVIPNGTSTTTRIQLGDASNLSGSGNFLNLFNTGSEVSIRAGTYSGGSGLPMTFYTGGSERMRIDTSGIVTGTSGNLMLVSGTAQASTSGTSIDFTGIPSWVKRITVMFTGVSTNGSSGIDVRLGYGSTTWVSSGYAGASTLIAATSVATSRSTTGCFMRINNATCVVHGQILISLQSGTTWTFFGDLGDSVNDQQYLSAYSLALGNTLTGVRLATTNGTDTFDAGSINILYE